MQTTVTLRDTRLSPAEKRKLDKINQRMQRYFRAVIALDWSFTESGRNVVANCAVHSRSGYYRARASAERLGAAMDLAYDKVVRQRRRTRVKAVTRRKRTVRKLPRTKRGR